MYGLLNSILLQSGNWDKGYKKRFTSQCCDQYGCSGWNIFHHVQNVLQTS